MADPDKFVITVTIALIVGVSIFVGVIFKLLLEI